MESEIFRQSISNSYLPNLKGQSTINVADFYAYLGYIFRLTGNTGGAYKISLVTPAYTTISRIPLAKIGYDDSPDVKLYEGGTAVTGGSSCTPLNAQRECTCASLVTCKAGVTYADDGTLIETISADIKNTPNLSLWYLKPETQYVITFSANCNYSLEWGEVPL